MIAFDDSARTLVLLKLRLFVLSHWEIQVNILEQRIHFLQWKSILMFLNQDVQGSKTSGSWIQNHQLFDFCELIIIYGPEKSGDIVVSLMLDMWGLLVKIGLQLRWATSTEQINLELYGLKISRGIFWTTSFSKVYCWYSDLLINLMIRKKFFPRLDNLRYKSKQQSLPSWVVIIFTEENLLDEWISYLFIVAVRMTDRRSHVGLFYVPEFEQDEYIQPISMG
jgi:hypothetical protein